MQSNEWIDNAEVALEELNNGAPRDSVAPFWRIIEPGSKIATRLSCDDTLIIHLRTMEATGGAEV